MVAEDPHVSRVFAEMALHWTPTTCRSRDFDEDEAEADRAAEAELPQHEEHVAAEEDEYPLVESEDEDGENPAPAKIQNNQVLPDVADCDSEKNPNNSEKAQGAQVEPKGNLQPVIRSKGKGGFEENPAIDYNAELAAVEKLGITQCLF